MPSPAPFSSRRRSTLSLAALVACGGGGGSPAATSTTPNPPTTATTFPAGGWIGTYRPASGTPQSCYVAFKADGTFRAMFANMTQLSGKITTNQGAIGSDSAITVFSPASFNTNGPASQSTVTGTFTDETNDLLATLKGEFAGPVVSGTFDWHQEEMPDATLAAMAGTYSSMTANTSTRTSMTLTVAADGTFTGTDSQGTVSAGRFTLVAGAANLADVQFTYTASATGSTPQAFTGLAVLVPKSATVTRNIYLSVDNGAIGFNARFD